MPASSISLQRTPDGKEMHMATNHLGHFTLTSLLAETLLATPDSRVVTLSSGAYKAGVIDFDDFYWERRPYNRIKSYGDSKLANLLFTKQLQTYFDKKGGNVLAVSAHPGLAASERQQSIGIGGALSRWLVTPLEKGCRSQLMAATSPTANPGDYYGPALGIWGAPVLQKLKLDVINTELAQALWMFSEKETGIKYP